MKKTLVSLFTMLVLVISLVPASSALMMPIELSKDFSMSDNGWNWNHTTLTLTLSGVQNESFMLENGGTVILADRTITTLESLFFNGQMTIRGNGALTVEYLNGGSDLNIAGGNIYINGTELSTLNFNSFTMTDGELNVTIKKDDADLSDFPAGASYIINLIRADKIEITGGTVALTAPNSCSGTLCGTDGSVGQNLILRDCTLTWSDGGDGNLASFDNVTIDNAKVQWLNQKSNSNVASIYASNFPTITRIKKESYNVEGPVDLFDGTKRYYIDFSNSGLLPDGSPTLPTPEPPTQSAAKTAEPTNDKLYVDGELAVPTAYKISGSNYFKIRDVAALLNGTDAQFSVGYDNATQSVTLTTGESYTKRSSDLAGVPAGNKEAVSSNDSIYINGEKAELTVYKIGGSNYFKLRDLGKALGFTVGYTDGYGAFIETDHTA